MDEDIAERLVRAAGVVAKELGEGTVVARQVCEPLFRTKVTLIDLVVSSATGLLLPIVDRLLGSWRTTYGSPQVNVLVSSQNNPLTE